jgi:hypothetical protein
VVVRSPQCSGDDGCVFTTVAPVPINGVAVVTVFTYVGDTIAAAVTAVFLRPGVDIRVRGVAIRRYQRRVITVRGAQAARVIDAEAVLVGVQVVRHALGGIFGVCESIAVVIDSAIADFLCIGADCGIGIVAVDGVDEAVLIDIVIPADAASKADVR